MKKILIFLLAVAILIGACWAALRLLDHFNFWDVLAQKVTSFLEQTVQSPPAQGDGDTPTPETGNPPAQQPQTPQTPGVTPPVQPQTPPQTGPGYDEDGCLVDADVALHALLYDAAIHFTEEVDIAHLDYTEATLKDEVARFFFTNPDLFYVDNKYSIYTLPGQENVRKIKLRYLTTIAEAQARLEFYNSVLDAVVAGIPVGATDFDKVLYLHDYLVQNYAYDYEGLAEEQATGESVAVRDAYSFFYGKVGVCQAYMLAMIALCEEAGIPALPVTSDEISHAWNLIKLDGKWYHVDVTWDDAGGEKSPVYPSFVSYKYFLLSGEALYNSGRIARWQTTEKASSSIYDTAPWHMATTPMCKNGEEYFCVLYDKAGNTPRIYRGTPVQMIAVQTLDAKWYSGPSTYYQNAWSSVVLFEDVMLLNTAKGFLYYDVDSNTLSEAVNLSASLGGMQIFGVCDVAADGTLTFVAAADYSGTFEKRTWQIPVPE